MSDKIVVPKVYKRWPVVIDEQGFRRLYDELDKILGTERQIVIKMKYSDRSSVETTSIEGFLNDENRKGRRILEVIISGKNGPKEIEIRFGSTKIIKGEEKYQPYIFLDIIGPDRQWVFVAQSEIEDRLKSFKAPRPPSFVIALATAICIFFLAILLAYIFKSHLKFLFTTDAHSGQQVLSGIFIFVLFLLACIAIITIVLLYRDITFCIGQEIERHQSRLKLRSNIFWSIFIALGIGIIGGIILKFF